MKVKITNQVRNELLKRVEITAEFTNEDATPSRAVIQEKVAILADGTPELTVINTINTAFGHANGTISAFIYDSEDDKVKASPKYVVEKNKYEAPKAPEPEPVVKEPAAEEAKEEPKAEAPAEKAEEKKE
jgi:ribosomal protein S24E